MMSCEAGVDFNSADFPAELKICLQGYLFWKLYKSHTWESQASRKKAEREKEEGHGSQHMWKGKSEIHRVSEKLPATSSLLQS